MDDGAAAGSIVAVHRSATYSFSKPTVDAIELLAGIGVVGDAHAGATVKHRGRMRDDPDQPNLRQVHLMAAELFDHLATKGFEVAPGQLGENVTTRGIDLLALPTGTLLRLGDEALVALTGLRNPCKQIDGIADGLLAELRGRDDQGQIVRRAGVMGVVLQSGAVRPGDAIAVTLPPSPHAALDRV